ncbi:MAG TPA: hypothetical protein PK514_01220 [Spirochaetota bacterium]|nr:hypothetical protein [Spirochaetota bacterium]
MAKGWADPMFNSVTGKTGDRVYCRRHGRLYVRRYVKPRNPGTDSQVINRAAFSLAVRQWRELTAEARDWYNSRTAKLPMNGMNLFISETLRGTRCFYEPVNSGGTGKRLFTAPYQVRIWFVLHGRVLQQQIHGTAIRNSA